VEIQTAVHEANMEKKLGVVAKRGDGSAADAVKPEGWIPPEGRIEAILDAA
jgi:predicted HAD superfamily Cof-like phosphohydrolase